jgi:lysozyme
MTGAAARTRAVRIGAGVAAAGAVAAAVALIAPWEGLRTQAYPDVIGVWTLCYGETRGVRPGDSATPAECRDMLAKAVAEFELTIRPCLPPVLPDQTRAAFVSLAYNIGTGAFCQSTVSRRALAGQVRAACEAILLYNRAGGKVVKGLVNRRSAERLVCLAGLGK